VSGSITSNYHFNLPTIGGSQDSWGSLTNSNWTALDGYLHSLAGTGGGSTSPSLPLTGGTISGNLVVNGQASVSGNLGVSGSINANGIGANTVQFGFPAVTNWLAFRSGGGDRVWQWQDGCTDTWHEATAIRYWNNNRTVMSLDYNGNLQILSDAYKPGGGPWIAASDERVKRNIRPYVSGLAQIMALQPISFEYNGKGGTTADGVTYTGVVAQQARAVMPELVFEQKLGTKDGSLDPRLLPGQLATNLGPLTLALVNCCKELAARVAVLEARCPG
jgi:hypothetical protein